MPERSVKTIEQRIVFAGVRAGELYDTYLDSRRHTDAIGAPAQVEPFVGGSVTAFGEQGVRGTILQLVPGRRIVQTWRSSTRWHADEDDSILVLTFEDGRDGAVVRLVQAGVPEREFELFDRGWHERYWVPWRASLASAPTKR